MKIIILKYSTSDVFIYYLPRYLETVSEEGIFFYLEDIYEMEFDQSDIHYMITKNNINIK